MANSVHPNKIVPHDNDVLCGRGVNIAHHPGNERFRTLVNARYNAANAETANSPNNSATEKRQIAEEVIRHIKALEPPGRFLKREMTPGRSRGGGSRGKNGTGLDLSGIWEVLSDRESIKKTCQALRDCSRTDRNGYAIGVVIPQDVIENAGKGTKRDGPDSSADKNGGGRVSPGVENAASWLKKQRLTGGVVPASNGLPGVLNPQAMTMQQMPPAQMGLQQAFGTNWNAAPVPSSASGNYANDFATQQNTQQVLQYQQNAALPQGMVSQDWSVSQAISGQPESQDPSPPYEDISPGDVSPGPLNITEL
mmetsp:Transcript_23735/g.34602  ORF Transcript_23735/g.34602 Transcript_23735/m.34602 type:complete len:309 (+) Transcript_23735:385-1311(+)|eukprot:CAMPEP_0195507554 /NCGR_PEP_ID=MMETSP0794_2-20130614/980_1 /TAXON_ID=515487 /ORGANISM="Stephanopyxis turris, Strain CCMP 815" /LENGTH=308 /DNA_ID=CAMNT_0040634277 /DNA_START=344 /DNA_END=1270 /DNA_ORIENTATION=+